MAENSKIEWTHHTANLWWGCDKVHAGCDNCYAEYFSDVRYKNGLWGSGNRRLIKKTFGDMDKFQKHAASKGEFHRVFIGSMMDIFEKSKPIINPDRHYTETDFLRQELFTRITWDEGLYNNLILLFLTKRPSNIPKMVPTGWLDNPPVNIMYGTSASDQETLNTMARQLLKVPGKHFLSLEPQIGFIDLNPLKQMQEDTGQRIDWIIQGGESGHHKRPFNLDWAYSMRDQCEEMGIPYFFKQIDKVHLIPDSLLIRQFPGLDLPSNQSAQEVNNG
jgi:protein gp37